MTDLEKSQISLNYARTMMMMAKQIEKEMGKCDSYYAYVKKGKEACEKSIELKRLWDEDKTDILMVA